MPSVVQYIVGRFLPPMLAWVSALLYRQVLLRCTCHPLVRLARRYDLALVAAACQAYCRGAR